MQKKTDTSTASKAYGKTLETPLGYEFSWDIYETKEELVAAKDEMTLDEQLKTRNTERQSKARQAALTAALTAAKIFKPTAENDPQVGLRDMVKTLLTAKLPNGEKRFTEEQAKQVASTTLGIEWED